MTLNIILAAFAVAAICFVIWKGRAQFTPGYIKWMSRLLPLLLCINALFWGFFAYDSAAFKKLMTSDGMGLYILSVPNSAVHLNFAVWFSVFLFWEFVLLHQRRLQRQTEKADKAGGNS